MTLYPPPGERTCSPRLLLAHRGVRQCVKVLGNHVEAIDLFLFFLVLGERGRAQNSDTAMQPQCHHDAHDAPLRQTCTRAEVNHEFFVA